VECSLASRGEVPRERKPVTGDGDGDDDDDNNNNK
jgi:hypothetical protein